MSALQRIAEFFTPKCERTPPPVKYEQMPTPVVKYDDFEAVEVGVDIWRSVMMLHSIYAAYSDSPSPDIKVIEPDEYDFDATRFEAVRKPPRTAYVVYRKKVKA